MRDFLLLAVLALSASQAFAIPQCPADGGANGDILLPNPADCASYYMCLNGVPYLMPCSTGLHWSDALKRCDYPNVANCEVTETEPTTVPTTSGPTTTKKPMPDKCPAEDGPDDVLLPNPADCGSFYKCLNGIPHLIPCPSGQHWSIELSRCDYPEIAQCHETETSVPTKPTEKPTSKPPVERPDKCPEVDGPDDVLLPNPEDCGSFFKCLKGEPHLIPCPPGQQWSVDLNRCDFPEIAHCEVKKIMREVDGDCPIHHEGYDIFFPNPEDCSTYYQCSNGVKILKECPVGTLWDAPMQRCDFAHNARCAE